MPFSTLLIEGLLFWFYFLVKAQHHHFWSTAFGPNRPSGGGRSSFSCQLHWRPWVLDAAALLGTAGIGEEILYSSPLGCRAAFRDFTACRRETA